MRHLLTFLFCWICAYANAQFWSIPAKSGDMQFNDIVYLETVYHQAGNLKTDTLPGTGFLITGADSNIYLITTKHQLQVAIGNNSKQRMANSLRIGRDKANMEAFDFNRLKQNKSYIASADYQDIAIISLKGHRNTINHLLRSGSKPVYADSLDVAEHAANDSFFLPGYNSFYNNWVRHVTAGLSPGTIKRYGNQSSTFLIEHFMIVSYCGSPLFKDDKIIGMVIHPTGIKSAESYLINPDQKVESAVAVKAKIILQLLTKLQQRAQNQHSIIPSENINKDLRLKLKDRY